MNRYDWLTPGLFTRRPLVFTNGCFDLLHAGHVDLLSRARDLGASLAVGLNSDASIARLKGASRPILPERERAAMLRALNAVDYVLPFDDDTPLELIERILPDVLVKGSDYTEDQIVGAAEVRSWGGRVVAIPHRLYHQSTTSIINRIKGLP